MLLIEGKLRMEIEERVWVSWSMIMGECMKGNGLMIVDMGKGLNATAMGIHMKVSFAEVKPMAMEFTNGRMEKSTKVSGLMDRKKGWVNGEVRMIPF